MTPQAGSGSSNASCSRSSVLVTARRPAASARCARSLARPARRRSVASAWRRAWVARGYLIEIGTRSSWTACVICCAASSRHASRVRSVHSVTGLGSSRSALATRWLWLKKLDHPRLSAECWSGTSRGKSGVRARRRTTSARSVWACLCGRAGRRPVFLTFNAHWQTQPPGARTAIRSTLRSPCNRCGRCVSVWQTPVGAHLSSDYSTPTQPRRWGNPPKVPAHSCSPCRSFTASEGCADSACVMRGATPCSTYSLGTSVRQPMRKPTMSFPLSAGSGSTCPSYLHVCSLRRLRSRRK